MDKSRLSWFICMAFESDTQQAQTTYGVFVCVGEATDQVVGYVLHLKDVKII